MGETMIDFPSLPFDLGEETDMLRETARAFAASVS